MSSIKLAFKRNREAGFVLAPLERYLSNLPDEDADRALNVNAPSSIGSCLRARYYSRVAGSRNGGTLEPRTRRIFDNGSGVHARLQEYLFKAGILLLDEIPVLNDFYNIQGHTDGLVRLPSRDVAVLEIKSINDRGFKELKVPKPEHVQQATTYMYCLEERRLYLHGFKKNGWTDEDILEQELPSYAEHYQHFKDGRKFTRQEKLDFQVNRCAMTDKILLSVHRPIDKVVILYENKNDQDLREFVVVRDDALVNQILEECKIVDQAVLLNNPPDRCCSKSSMECRFCNFSIECWN